MRRVRRDDRAAQQAEVVDLAPFLQLARAMRDEAVRIGDDPVLAAAALDDVVASFPVDGRRAAARAVFAALPAPQQWEVLERVYGDAEIADLLDAEHTIRRQQALRTVRARRLAVQIVTDGQLDTRQIAPGAELTLGLFRPHDVRTALARGHVADGCARRLVLRTTDTAGFVRVIADVFNPTGTYYVTADYDEQTWRARDQLAGHATVRVGAITSGAGAQPFDPTLYPGGRVDVETEAGVRPGQLHLGYATLDGTDLLTR